MIVSFRQMHLDRETHSLFAEASDLGFPVTAPPRVGQILIVQGLTRAYTDISYKIVSECHNPEEEIGGCMWTAVPTGANAASFAKSNGRALPNLTIIND